LNPSSNRWTFSPTLNGQNGTSSLFQKALFLVEGHASRNLTPQLWVR
jgi:hypothetical protein